MDFMVRIGVALSWILGLSETQRLVKTYHEEVESIFPHIQPQTTIASPPQLNRTGPNHKVWSAGTNQDRERMTIQSSADRLCCYD